MKLEIKMRKLRVASLFAGCGGLDLGFKQADFELVWANDYCQGFSLNNTKRSEEDERTLLYKEMLRVIKDKQPKFFVGENVEGMFSFGDRTILSTIIKECEKLGYNTTYRILNASDYGVAQNRKRIFIMGNRIGAKNIFPHPTHGELNLFDLTLGTTKVPKASDTILASNSPIHPNLQRRLSIRECAILQSFPHDFEFFGSISSMQRQIGNAVPVMVAKQIALCIKQQLE